jgi:hypothetical protein
MLDSIEYFIKYIFAPFILCTGLIGNITGFIIMKSKKLENIGPRTMYKCMFIMDTLFLFQVLLFYSTRAYGKNISTVSELLCKMYNYLNYSLCPISPMLLCYISMDRFVAIRLPSSKGTMRRERNQLLYFMIILTFNALYYIPMPFAYSIINLSESTNQTRLTCYFAEFRKIGVILSWMDLANYVLMPFTLMFLCSFLIIFTIFQSRRNVSRNQKSNKNLDRDIRFSVTCFVLNLLYLLLNLPLAIILLFPINFSATFFSLTNYLFYLSYAVNFYILLFTNSLIRRQFLELFKGKRPANHGSHSARTTRIS